MVPMNRSATSKNRPALVFARCCVLLLALATAACAGLPGQPVLPTLAATIALPPAEQAAPGAGAPSAGDQGAPAADTSQPGGGQTALPTLAFSFAPQATPTPGPLWVANPADQVVLRIDPQQNAVEARIPVGGRPEMVTAAEGAVWVLDRENDQLLRIDPASGEVGQPVLLPRGEVETLAAGAGSVWVGMTGRVDFEGQTPAESESLEDAEFIPPASVVRIDPRTGEQIGQYSVQPVSRLLVNGAALWVLSHSVIDTPLQVIDLANQLGMAVPIRNAPEWLPVDALAVDPSGLWLFSTTHAKIFRATPDGRILAAIDLEARRPTGYADLLRWGDDLWAATPWGTVLRIDANTNKILAQSDLNTPLTGLIAGNDAVWALSQQSAALFRLDPVQAGVVARIETGAMVQPTVIPSPTPRVVVWKPCPDAPNSRLKVGDLAYVTKDPPVPNRVRKEPNREAEVLGHITPGGSMELIDGPQCADGWVWWKVKNANLEGWTAEGDPETYWLVPLFK